MPQPITIVNLLNSISAFPEKIRHDPYQRSFTLALGVLKHFLGSDWPLKYCNPVESRRGFMQVEFDAPDKDVQLFRTIDLGELLFNLQHVSGFEHCLERLRNGDVESAFAELDVARMLFINCHFFWFKPPQGEKGQDFDFGLLYPNGHLACIEAKCNIEGKDLSIGTIRNTLIRAKKQLPPDCPGIIFVKVPSAAYWAEGFQGELSRAAIEFLRNTQRVVSIKYYVAPLQFREGRMSHTHAFMEITNPEHKFNKSNNWALMQNWKPPSGYWNSMPPWWVRLVFFPVRTPPPDFV